MAEPRLEKGSEGQAVTDLQEGLLALQLRPGEADGVFGLFTDSAVKAFQTWAFIESDGVVGPDTWRKFDNADQSNPELEEGAHGLSVRRVQRRLMAAADLEPSQIDGRFGPVTATAVRALQKRSELEVDGVVGPKTWEVLLEIDDWAVDL